MAVTVSAVDSAYLGSPAASALAAAPTEWKIEFSANNDAAQVDLRGVSWIPGKGVLWTRSDADDVSVTWTIEDGAIDAATPSTAGWHAHTATGIGAFETAPIVGLRFKRTGSDGDAVYIRGYGLGTPYQVTGV